MKISAPEEYGLRCLLRIARTGAEGSLTLAELAQAEGMSAPNVAKLMQVLRKGDFVHSTRGQSGGYALARPAAEISVGEVLACLGGRLFEPDFCSKHAGVERMCGHTIDCSIRSVWRMVQGAVDDVLGNLTLADLISSERDFDSRARAGRATIASASA